MSNTKHTPGPWRLIGGINGHDLNVRILGKDPTKYIDRELSIITIDDYHVIRDHLYRRFADMKLISAAPDLLAACEMALAYLDYSSSELVRADYNQLKRAIKKATN